MRVRCKVGWMSSKEVQCAPGEARVGCLCTRQHSRLASWGARLGARLCNPSHGGPAVAGMVVCAAVLCCCPVVAAGLSWTMGCASVGWVRQRRLLRHALDVPAAAVGKRVEAFADANMP